MGAYSSIAARRMFAQPDLRFYPHFGDVFDAVESGEIEYGVLPIENSSAGSVSAVYDLMKKHNFYIAAALKLRIDHCLVAKGPIPLQKVTKVYSHEQGINQCSAFSPNIPTCPRRYSPTPRRRRSLWPIPLMIPWPPSPPKRRPSFMGCIF